VALAAGWLALLASVAGAEEWYEAYRRGVRALGQGRADQAVTLLERAAALRPEPGRNVVTYGTNVEREYFPYLRLAEASLQLRDAARARAALERSDKWAREPAEQRQRLWARLEELTPKPAATAAPTAAPGPPLTLPPPLTASFPTTLPAAPTQHPAPSAAAPPATTGRMPPLATAGPQPTAPVEAPAAEPAPAPAGTASLDVVSQPPGASVYVDDELVGTTDPEWGRLVRTGLPPGRHRVRLSLAGHEDAVGDVDLEAGARADFRRRLAPAAAPDRRPIVYAAIAVALLALTVWAWRRLTVEREPRPSGMTPTPRSPQATPTPVRGTPPGMGSPGVTRDASGREFFGEYQLLEPLGRGGMASVWKAERNGEPRALKRPLYAFLEEPEFLERFVREAEIGRTLHHPNVIRILEHGKVEGVPFLAMELLPGETLQARIERHDALPAREAAQVVVQIAEALDYAHSKGVVHRDLKPSNVMLLADGDVKVMDFGIARARRFEGLTVTGAFLGSPDYIAPEAIEGGETDARSDLYSLGVTFYEALTGRRPFTADTPFAVLRKHLSEVPARPATLRPDVPPELERMVLKLLQKAPADRFASAEDLVRELRDFLNRAA
jgi:hypothetical protein